MSRDRLSEISGGTHLQVDLDAYQNNIRQLKLLAGHRRSLLAVVKADAYGHGAIVCAAAAIDAGAEYLAVARIDEALQLRRAGVAVPLLILGAPNVNQLTTALHHNIELSVGTRRALDRIVASAKKEQCPARLHLKVETGLHRYGATPKLALSLARDMYQSEWVDFQGVYSHYSSADEEARTPTWHQLDIMSQFVRGLADEEMLPPQIHIANSAGLIAGDLGESTMVRAGIASYGLNPSAEITLPSSFKPVMSLHSVISRRFQLVAGDSVSYNRTYAATGNEDVGTVPVGYGDGLPRSLHGRGKVAIGGCLSPILGRVCMDQITVRVPTATKEGDRVIIFGDGMSGEMTTDSVAEAAGTNNYEIVTRMSVRLPRLYIKNGIPDSWTIPLLGESGKL